LRFWRIVAGHRGAKSMILGDWLRNNYISIGWEDPDQPSRRRFDEMQIGDRIVVVTDGCIFAIGQILSDLYEKEEPGLYPYRRDVMWYKVTKIKYDEFPEVLRNKLSHRHALLELRKDEWETLVLLVK